MKLRLLIEFEYDEQLMHSGDDDPEAKAWFLNLLKNNELCLHENTEIGDDIGTVRVTGVLP